MAKVSAFSTISRSISTPSTPITPSQPLTLLPIRTLHFQQTRYGFAKKLTLKNNKSRSKDSSSYLFGIRRLRSVEEETQVTEEVEQQPEAGEEVQEQSEQPAVSVPVSPSDTLTMYFEAEGTMNEASIPTVTKALEGTEGIADLKVQVLEGIASVQLTKQTTVQATGVASSLVELIQGSGFKLQTLNLSFEDEEDLVA